MLSLAAPLLAGTAFHDPVFGTHETANIQYGTGLINNGANSFNLLLDLFQPTNIGVPVPATSPGIVLIHGGSFTTGDKNDVDSLAATYASYGYNVVSINYRLIGQNPPSSSPGPADGLVAPPPPFATLPNPQGTNAINAAVQDSQAAMGWMRDNAALFHIDPTRIGIGGASAGAITALLEAYNNPPAHARRLSCWIFLAACTAPRESFTRATHPHLSSTARPIRPCRSAATRPSSIN